MCVCVWGGCVCVCVYWAPPLRTFPSNKYNIQHNM